MKSKILILLVFVVSFLAKSSDVLAQPYPTVFIHGHNEDGWTMWDNLIKKLPAKEKHYIATEGGWIVSSGDNSGCLSAESCAKDSIWLFDYYKNTGGGCETPTSQVLETDKACRGKIGNPKDLSGNKILRDPLPGEENVWGDGKTYNTVRSYVENLAVAIDGILEATGSAKVNIVAHSEGGLVARAYVKWYGGADKVHRILFIATPNYGLSDVAEHVAQYGLWCYAEINIVFKWIICDKGMLWDPFWQRIGEDLEMYPKLIDGFTFGGESKPPPTILGKNLPSYVGKSWIDWLNLDPLIPNSIEYATIAGSYKKQAIDIASNTVAACECAGYKPYGNCCEPLCWWKAGPCNCCGFPTIVTFWYLIKDMLGQRPVPDDITVNISEVQLSGAAFNDVIVAAHQRISEPPFDKIDEEHLLTECSYTAMRITQWIYNNESIYQSYTDPEVNAGSSKNGGGDSIPFYKFKPYKFVYLPPFINPETDKQFLQVQGAPFDLKNLMPQKGPYDSAGQEKEPDFFLQFPGESNAIEVYAVDYESTNNVVVGAILAEVTEGGPYTHDFATCARYAGYSLDDIKVVTIGDAYYYEAVLSKSSELVYEISFYLLINLDEVVVDSVWISDSVGVPQDQVVINVQIWTINPEETEKLVSAFLANVGDQIFGLNYANNVPKEEPNTFFKTAKVTENGNGIEVSVFNRCKLEEVKIDELLWPKAGDSQFSVSYSTVFSSGDQKLYIPHPQLDSAVIYLQNESQAEFKDKIYLNKPLNPCNLNPQAWWSYNDAAVGGDSIIEITTSIPDAPQNPHKENVFLEIPSSVHLEGKVTTAYQYGFVGYGISLSSCQNVIDLSSASGFSFMVKGDSKTYRVKLESASIEDYDYYGFNFTAPSNWTYIDIPFSSFVQEGWGAAKPFSASDILNLSFQTIGQPYESVSLDVSDIVFYKKSVAQEAELQISGLVPYLSLDNISQTFTLIGTGFDEGIEVYVGENKLDTTLISENYLQFVVLSGMTPGAYDLEILSVDQAPIILEGAVLIIDSQNELLKTDLCTQEYVVPVEPPILADAGAEQSADLSTDFDANEFVAPSTDVVEIVDASIQDLAVAMPDNFAEDKNSIGVTDINIVPFDQNVIGEDSKYIFDIIFYDSVAMIDLETKNIDAQEENIFVGIDGVGGVDTQHSAAIDSINKDAKSAIETISSIKVATDNKKGDSGCSYSTSSNFKPIYCLLVLIVFVAVRKRRSII